MPKKIYKGKLADPEFRRERARKGVAARESLDNYVSKVVAKAPSLTPEHIEKLRALLPPAEGDDQ